MLYFLSCIFCKNYFLKIYFYLSIDFCDVHVTVRKMHMILVYISGDVFIKQVISRFSMVLPRHCRLITCLTVPSTSHFRSTPLQMKVATSGLLRQPPLVDIMLPDTGVYYFHITDLPTFLTRLHLMMI